MDARSVGNFRFIQDYNNAAKCNDSNGNICFHGLVQVPSSALSNNIRHQVVVTMDTSETKIYLDGMLQDTGSGYDPNFNSLKLAARYEFDDGRFFDGQIDDVRIYNRALSAIEVQQLYTMTNNLQGGDCNDTSIWTHPLATEVCDLQDNDCDSSIDEGVASIYYLDADADGYSTGTTASRCDASDVGLR